MFRLARAMGYHLSIARLLYFAHIRSLVGIHLQPLPKMILDVVPDQHWSRCSSMDCWGTSIAHYVRLAQAPSKQEREVHKIEKSTMYHAV